MGKKLYVGNMNYDTTEAKLREIFSAHGEVTSVNLVTDRDTGRPRGFAFVEMATDEAAKAAMTALNGQSVDGRQLKVDEAQPRRTGGGGGGGFRDRGGRGGGRGRDFGDRDYDDRGGYRDRGSRDRRGGGDRY
ncbi:MAG: RNA-binding protein [Anaerolineae bacterium]|nr:RNA-binding protein [Anaerolineae bacterium]